MYLGGPKVNGIDAPLWLLPPSSSSIQPSKHPLFHTTQNPKTEPRSAVSCTHGCGTGLWTTLRSTTPDTRTFTDVDDELLYSLVGRKGGGEKRWEGGKRMDDNKCVQKKGKWWRGVHLCVCFLLFLLLCVYARNVCVFFFHVYVDIAGAHVNLCRKRSKAAGRG